MVVTRPFLLLRDRGRAVNLLCGARQLAGICELMKGIVPSQLPTAVGQAATLQGHGATEPGF